MLAKRVRELILEACKANGVPEFCPTIRFEWSEAMTRTAGVANYGTNRITFGSKIFRAMDVAEQENTVVHEACHLIARHRYGSRISPHGKEWKMAMRVAGYEPKRCHNIQLGLEHRQKGTRPFTCGCPGKVHYLGARRAAKAVITRMTLDHTTDKIATEHLAGYKCRKCKQGLRLKRS